MSAHAEFLRVASKDAALASSLKDNYRKANLGEQDRLMLEFVEKLTLYPWMVVESDIIGLRDGGFPDATILHIVLGSAHFNYLNRMADGIGIRFEYQTDVPQGGSRSRELERAPTFTTQRAPVAVRNTHPAWIATPTSTANPRQHQPWQNLYDSLSYNREARDLAFEWRTYQLKGTERLDARLRAQLALYISGLNHCEYSAYWLKKEVQQLGEPHACCELLASGEIPPDLPLAERVLFTHASRLTREPASTTEAHIQQLREMGLDDHGILQLTMLCSYLSFENRVALGLGLALESETRTTNTR